jgi:hypothetical protein
MPPGLNDEEALKWQMQAGTFWAFDADADAGAVFSGFGCATLFKLKNKINEAGFEQKTSKVS